MIWALSSSSESSRAQDSRWMCDLTVPDTWVFDGSQSLRKRVRHCGDGGPGWGDLCCLPEWFESACERAPFLLYLPPPWTWRFPHPFPPAGSSCRRDLVLFGMKAMEWKKRSPGNKSPPHESDGGRNFATFLGHPDPHTQASLPGTDRAWAAIRCPCSSFFYLLTT